MCTNVSHTKRNKTKDGIHHIIIGGIVQANRLLLLPMFNQVYTLHLGLHMVGCLHCLV